MSAATQTFVRHFSDYDWTWKRRESHKPLSDELIPGDLSGWRKAASFPSEIHVELLNAGLVPDPYVGFNEHKVQCESRLLKMLQFLLMTLSGVGEVEWLYKCTFSLDDGISSHRCAILRFYGLDTICDVYLVSRHPAPL